MATPASLETDTIAAVATPPGRGGIGIVRLSGPTALAVARQVCGMDLQPRHAHFCSFHDTPDSTEAIDSGIALYFPGPDSFTGEDVAELQGHGGPVVMDMILRRCCELGARQARPGEFSERAFLNDKLDLTQAEAIADLINSTTESAARSANRSLQGRFANEIERLMNRVTELRAYVEAAIDFPEEEIDFLAEGGVLARLQQIMTQIDQVTAAARQGQLLSEGLRLVIAGQPNVGKSSLLNALSGQDSAIVTAQAGTTRDVLRQAIQLDGMPLHIVDTAGIREASGEVEQEGIRRAWLEIEAADHVLLVVDGSRPNPAPASPDMAPAFVARASTRRRGEAHGRKDAEGTVGATHASPIFEGVPPLATASDSVAAAEGWRHMRAWEPALTELRARLPAATPITLINNKCDLSGAAPGVDRIGELHRITLSAKTRQGLDLLREHLKNSAGYQPGEAGQFSARRRHLEALRRAREALLSGRQQLEGSGAGELLAEDLRACQQQLGEICGQFSSDDLLGEIFSSFCIGK